MGAEDDGEVEPVGVLDCGFGGVDGDVQVVAGDGEDVAVEGDVADGWVVDGFSAGLLTRVREFSGLPKLEELVAGA